MVMLSTESGGVVVDGRGGGVVVDGRGGGIGGGIGGGERKEGHRNFKRSPPRSS